MPIDPRVLRTFLAVCRAGSISGAARTLNISQPSVSVAIARLEQQLGSTLLERGRRGIGLTPAGEALLQRAEAMDVLLRDAAEAVALASRGVGGSLTVGGTPGALVSLVPAAVARMQRGRGVALSIVERSDDQLTVLLRRGEIEVAVMTTGIAAPPDDLVERTIARDPLALVVGRAHDALGSAVSLREVASLGWVLPHAQGAFHRQIEAMFLSAETPFPSDVVRCDSLLVSKAIVGQGSRVTMLPEGVVAAERAAGQLRALPLRDAEISRSIGIRTVAARPLSPLAAAFVAAIGADAQP